MRFLGLDPSLTATGICGVDDQTETWSPPKGMKGDARLAWFDDQFKRLLADATTAPNMTLCEGYAYGRPNQAHQLGELGGVLRLRWRREYRFLVVVPPSTLKKYATGKGNASKEEVLVQAVLKSGREMTNDAADAWWLRQIGLAWYMPSHHQLVEVPPMRWDAIADLDWPERKVIEAGLPLLADEYRKSAQCSE